MIKINDSLTFQVRAYHIERTSSAENPKLTATEDVDLNAQPQIEILKNPPEWKYVERILPKSTVPSVAPKECYSSGWTPQQPNAFKQPYFIKRSKNHMVPVYLQIDYRGTRRRTFIKHITGDIWKLHNELLDYIEYYMAKKERSRVNEFTGQITINGDYVNLLKDYLVSKGF